MLALHTGSPLDAMLGRGLTLESEEDDRWLLRGNVVGISDDERLELREENARKLYMAMTRAGQGLVVVASQRLPEPMELLFQLAS